jgi:hypothetical protein
MIKENGDAVHVNHRDHLGVELTEIPCTFSNISAESTISFGTSSRIASRRRII